jgi:UDP-galactopyranose mutase
MKILQYITMQSIDNKVVSRESGKQRGWPFSKNEFSGLVNDSQSTIAISKKRNQQESEMVVQALKALGRERIDADVRQKLAEKWTPKVWQKILRDARTAPAWVCDVIRAIAKAKQTI